jgi:hypothetical protein
MPRLNSESARARAFYARVIIILRKQFDCLIIKRDSLNILQLHRRKQRFEVFQWRKT